MADPGNPRARVEEPFKEPRKHPHERGDKEAQPNEHEQQLGRR
jgi:hypothetical protein